MSGIKDLIREGPVHSRLMEVKTYPAADGKLVIEGRLRDERFVTGYHWNGEAFTPGVIHNMAVRFLVGGAPPVILDAEAEMLDVPNENCPATLDSIEAMKGLPIASGYGEEVRRRVGGVKGCAHLTQLIMIMGTAALHGAWIAGSREPRPVPSSPEAFSGLSQLVNSCRLWREDGPILAELREEMQRIANEGSETGE
ncbi:MAG: DUF2889 domain-containing protein [Deltaproteobacteria bacterium]|nr:DUF2889 domain-containing protein [Deltaproteobacteria bacterium]